MPPKEIHVLTMDREFSGRKVKESLPIHWDGIGREDFLALPDDFLGFGVVGEDAGVAAGGGLAADFGDPFFVFGDDFFVAGFANEVVPLIGILFHVVEFFAAIGVADVAPVLGADAMVVMIVSGDGRALAFGFGVFELRHEADALKVGW